MTSQTLRTIQSAFHESLPVRRLATRQRATWLLRTAGTGLLLGTAFTAAVAVGFVTLLSLGGVLSFG
jgi:hypothetical protein